MTTSYERIAVVGAGTMGHGIAQLAAMSGFEVHLVDVSSEALERALASIAANLEKGIAKGKVTAEQRDGAMARLETLTDLAEATAGADVVIEAAPERLEIKTTLFADIAAHAPAHALLATNTSSLSVTAIAAATPFPERVIGMHFFNPPYILKLLELVRAERTADATVAAAKALGARLNREVIVVSDSPGFATSRLGLILGLEAMRMLQQGVASAADIDRAMELGYGHPMGPLKTTDLVGLDVRLAIAEYLHAEVGEQFRPPAILRRMVRAGKLGKKSGEGFYRW